MARRLETTNGGAGLVGPVTRRSFLSSNAALGGLIVTGGGLSALLAACGGDDDETGASGVTAADVEQASGNIDLFGWSYYEASSQDAAVDAKWTAISAINQIPVKLRSGEFDVVVTTSPQIPQYVALDKLVPIDTSLIPNYKNIASSLQDDPVWRNPDGELLAVPFAFAVSLLTWDSGKVPEPNSMEDLLKPEYEGVIGMNDDFQTLRMVMRGLGLNFQEATKDDLAQTVSYLDELRPQIKTIAPFGEEVTLYGRGDISVFLWNAGGSLYNTEQKNNPDIAGKFEPGALSFGDGLSVTKDSNVATGLSWINQALTEKAQRDMVAASGALPSVEAALDRTALPDVYRNLSIDEILEGSPVMGPIPIESDGDLVTVDELSDAWDDFKASF